MTQCPFCNRKIPVEGCAEHFATCGLDSTTLTEIHASEGGQETEDIDMDALAEVVRRSGVKCIIEQTGGGTATLFAGDLISNPEEQDYPRYGACAGPGLFRSHTGLTFADAWASRGEFYIGPDDGESVDYIDCETLTIDEMAAHIVRIVQESTYSPEQAACEQCTAKYLYHAGLHAGHMWTNTECPAYRSHSGSDCICGAK